jgi:hypothetical protein
MSKRLSPKSGRGPLPESSTRCISAVWRPISFIFGQLVALAEYYQPAEFQLSGFNRTNVIEGGSWKFRPLQLPLGWWYGHLTATGRKISARRTLWPNLTTLARTADFWRFFENRENPMSKTVRDRAKVGVAHFRKLKNRLSPERLVRSRWNFYSLYRLRPAVYRLSETELWPRFFLANFRKFRKFWPSVSPKFVVRGCWNFAGWSRYPQAA